MPLENAPSKYPTSRWVGSPHFTPGNRGRLAVVLHIAEGGYQSSIDYMRNRGVSAHFIVSEIGRVSQMVSVHDTAFGNGLTFDGVNWISPDPRNKVVHPTWQRIQPGINPNLTTISIEHAGFHTTARPKVQLDATVSLLKWLAGWFPSLSPYKPGYTLIGHSYLDTVDRINCPGPFFNLERIATMANPPPLTQSFYRVKGLPIYEDSMLTRPIGQYLPADSVIEIDRTHAEQPADYALSAGHLKTGAGFVDLNGAERV